MILHSLWLQNFRNHKDLVIELDPAVTLILGPNGSGKSNILEAIYLLAAGRSSRAEKIEQMVGWDGEVARVKGLVNLAKVSNLRKVDTKQPGNLQSSNSDGEANQIASSPASRNPRNDVTTLQATLTRGTVQGKLAPLKTLEVNGVRRQLRKFAGHLRAVLFSPADMRLIEGSPTRRRDFLDDILTQTFPEYYRSLLSYTKALRRRNEILQAIRDQQTSVQQLYFWDKLLIKEGNLITEHRQKFIDFLNQENLLLGRNVATLRSYSVEYHQSPISPERLQRYHHPSLAAGTTLVGPHRDDISMSLRGTKQSGNPQGLSSDYKSHPVASSQQSQERLERAPRKDAIDLSTYGSRGQQRLAVLWLKLGASAFIHSQTGEHPILLLDDIFSELDHPHRELIHQAIQNHQTIITAADQHLVENLSAKTINLPDLGA